jgi:hypothetical protein
MLVAGFASIYFVKYSTARRCSCPSLELTCQLCQCPITEEAMTEWLVMKAELGPSTNGKISDKLRMLLLALLCHQSLLASRNLTEGLWWLELWHLCGLRRLLCEFLRVTLGLWPCLCIIGGDQIWRSYIGHYRLFEKLWLVIMAKVCHYRCSPVFSFYDID